MLQSITALVLIPLVLWFCLSLAFLPNANYTTVLAWLSSPFNGVLMIVILIAGFYHASLGMTTIYEDYISAHSTRKTAIIITNVVLFLCAIIGVLSMLKLLITS